MGIVFTLSQEEEYVLRALWGQGGGRGLGIVSVCLLSDKRTCLLSGICVHLCLSRISEGLCGAHAFANKHLFDRERGRERRRLGEGEG